MSLHFVWGDPSYIYCANFAVKDNLNACKQRCSCHDHMWPSATVHAKFAVSNSVSSCILLGIAHCSQTARNVNGLSANLANLGKAVDWYAHLMSTGIATSSPMEPRVWTLDELSILNEIRKPVAVIASGVYENARRYSAVMLFAALITSPLVPLSHIRP